MNHALAKTSVAVSLLSALGMSCSRDAMSGPGGTGGTTATGGKQSATGGSPSATGGSPSATGGSPSATGGSPSATGGSGGASSVSDAGPLGCLDNGHTYAIGESFKRDCNTCFCTATGTSCTLMLCPFLPDAAADLATPDSARSCEYGGRRYAIGETFKLDCNTCSCTTNGFACTAMACLTDAGRDLGPSQDGGSCRLSSNITFGYDGGNAMYVDVNRLTSTTFTITRTYSVWTGEERPATTCSPSLPACGAPNSVNVATIAADLAAPELQSLWGLPQEKPALFGSDPRPTDGAVYSIELDDARKILVGTQCASPLMSSCRSIPASLVRLTQDLQTLAKTMAADPVCAKL